jgi:hypothetical protein
VFYRTSTSALTTNFTRAAVVGVLDGAQQEPEHWASRDPLFCLRAKGENTFLHIDGDTPFRNDACGPRGTFSLQLHVLAQNTTPSSYGCENGLQKGAACCPWTCSSCAGSTTNTSATCVFDGTNTTAPAECCSAALLSPIVSPDTDFCSPRLPNATLDERTDACVLDVPHWPNLPRDNAYELTCIRHSATGNFVGLDRSTSSPKMRWKGGDECSVEAGTVWMLFPSTVAESAFERVLGTEQDIDILNSATLLTLQVDTLFLSLVAAMVLVFGA